MIPFLTYKHIMGILFLHRCVIFCSALTLPECVLVTPDSIAVLAVRFEQSLATDRAIKGHAVFSTEHLQLGLRHRFANLCHFVRVFISLVVFVSQLKRFYLL